MTTGRRLPPKARTPRRFDISPQFGDLSTRLSEPERFKLLLTTRQRFAKSRRVVTSELGKDLRVNDAVERRLEWKRIAGHRGAFQEIEHIVDYPPPKMEARWG